MKLFLLEQDIFEQGKQEGVKQGIQQGMIISQVKILKEFNVCKSDIIKRIKEEFNLSEEEAKKYLN